MNMHAFQKTDGLTDGIAVMDIIGHEYGQRVRIPFGALVQTESDVLHLPDDDVVFVRFAVKETHRVTTVTTVHYVRTKVGHIAWEGR